MTRSGLTNNQILGIDQPKKTCKTNVFIASYYRQLSTDIKINKNIRIKRGQRPGLTKLL